MLLNLRDVSATCVVKQDRVEIFHFHLSGNFLTLPGLLPAFAAVFAFEQVRKIVVDVKLGPGNVGATEDLDVG